MSQVSSIKVRPGLWSGLKNTAARVQDWFVVQSAFVKAVLVSVAVLIPASGIYSAVLMHRQAVIADQVKMMAKAGDVWKLNDSLPVVFGPGSVLNFVETRPVDRISVIYEPLMWDVSERIVLIESQGKQHAFYPSDMETRIFTEKAVTAPWGGKLVFIPRSELSARSLALFERLDQRFAEARPEAEKNGWKAGLSGALSVALS
ncbi:conserved hypothetical protein, partial [Ricinus communis]